MRDWETLKTKYLNFDRSQQLGNLASSLARIRRNIAETDQAGNQVAIAVIEECQYFTEWTITTLNTMENEADLLLAAELLRLGRQLTSWKWQWSELESDEAYRLEVATLAQQWSQEMLERSGLLQTQ
jgi:hypothetical protein